MDDSNVTVLRCTEDLKLCESYLVRLNRETLTPRLKTQKIWYVAFKEYPFPNKNIFVWESKLFKTKKAASDFYDKLLAENESL